MAEKIDGKRISALIKDEIAEKISKIKSDGHRVPGLSVILVGEDPASQVYVRNKGIACEKAGMSHQQINLDASTSSEKLRDTIVSLNEDPSVDGILVQLPLPGHINEEEALKWILPEKDVDGFNPVNMGKLVLGQDGFVPCTPYGIMKLLEHSNIDLSGKHVVIVGRSNIVGKPMSMLAVQKAAGANATVTIAHSRTANLEEVVKQADVVVAAIGKSKFIKAEMVKQGAVVIDVGINRDENGKLCGDVDFEEVQHKASFITPVPGGVGPMTIAMLLWNTLKSCQKRQNLSSD